MKKLLIITMCLSLATVFTSKAADFRVGLDGGYSISSTSEETGDAEDNSSNQNMLLTPYFSIFPTEMVEVSVGVPIGYIKTKTEMTDGEMESESIDKSFQIGGRVGAYFHLINLDHFHLAVGPQFQFVAVTEPTSEMTNDEGDLEEADSPYEKYSDIAFAATIPVKLDYVINETFGIRLGLEALGFSYYALTTQLLDAEDETTSSYSEFSFLGMTLPTIGLFVNF